MSAMDSLSAELAFKANVDAANRDYVCEPHLGEWHGLGSVVILALNKPLRDQISGDSYLR